MFYKASLDDLPWTVCALLLSLCGTVDHLMHPNGRGSAMLYIRRWNDYNNVPGVDHVRL
jgi:hypothetical protein